MYRAFYGEQVVHHPFLYIATIHIQFVVTHHSASELGPSRALSIHVPKLSEQVVGDKRTVLPDVGKLLGDPLQPALARIQKWLVFVIQRRFQHSCTCSA